MTQLENGFGIVLVIGAILCWLVIMLWFAYYLILVILQNTFIPAPSQFATRALKGALGGFVICLALFVLFILAGKSGILR